MFVNVAHVPTLVDCRALAWGHTDPMTDDGFERVTTVDFIHMMSPEARKKKLGPGEFNSPEAIVALATKWNGQTGIEERAFFKGNAVDMAVIAAKKCLAKARISPGQLDAIIGGTNTGPGYPSLADHVKLGLGDELSSAMCFDVAEACPVGGISIMQGWNLIKSSMCQRVLVVCSEKATTLTDIDNWQGANLFGDAAFAVLLVAGDHESFLFFDAHSMPFGGNLNKVVKDEDMGFFQDGLAVHKWVGNVVAPCFVEAVQRAGIDASNIKHLVPHQPSAKTLDLFFRKVMEHWPDFDGQCHRNVEYTGNTSGASTGSIISRQIDEGMIRSGDLVAVSTFGSGLAICNYAIRI